MSLRIPSVKHPHSLHGGIPPQPSFCSFVGIAPFVQQDIRWLCHHDRHFSPLLSWLLDSGLFPIISLSISFSFLDHFLLPWHQVPPNSCSYSDTKCYTLLWGSLKQIQNTIGTQNMIIYHTTRKILQPSQIGTSQNPKLKVGTSQG